MRRPRVGLPRSLRARLLVAIAAVVAVSIGVTLAVGAELTRRAVQSDAMASLDRQAELLAAGNAPAADVGRFLATEQERAAILSRAQALLLLPPGAAATLDARGAARGTLALRGTRYLFAARVRGDRAVVLLRAAQLQASDWTRFWVGFAIAGVVGLALAALSALLLARAVARPVARVAAAATRLARGERPEPLQPQGAAEVRALASSFNRMSAELERAQETERRFLLSVSHELKTPLTAIRGHAEALVEGVVPGATGGSVIEREARRLERLIGDLLDLARLRRRAFAVAAREIDLGAIASEAVLRHEQQARAYGVSLEAEAESGAAALGDPDRLLQAVSNLVENALRCTPSGGSVKVVARPSALAVADTGPGLEADELRRAFERFFLFNRYGSTRPVGTGLGLAIVKELAEAMGGSVEVESEPERGSVFTLRLLPAAEHARRRGPTPAGEPVPVAGA